MAIQQNNFELDLALFIVEKTDHNLFLTGKAGTGKTTFLRNVVSHTQKKHIVLAPTGIAAVNAGAMTIHSFFQFEFGPYLPGITMPEPSFKMKKSKIELIKALELIIIDEISMVRADLLDHIDYELRRIRQRDEPFGGVQLLMIGDLQQLPPVIKDEDIKLLSLKYNSLYFFDSKVLRNTDYHCIELNAVYRQTDSKFIDILNRARSGDITQDDLRELNSRYIYNFRPIGDEKYIRLVTHNRIVDTINAAEMGRLTSPAFVYNAKISGSFSSDSYPTSKDLELKVGAQVMFVRNDPDRRFINGTLGEISYLDQETVRVRIPNNDEEINLEPIEWESIKYTYDENRAKVNAETAGRFVQYPIKAAWAVTIHKCQGLTFDRVIIDAKFAFSPGQTYVALSRCRSLDGIVLSSRLSQSSFITDSIVSDYVRGASIDVQTLANSVNYEHFEYEETAPSSAEPQMNGSLISELKKWRSEEASRRDVPHYVVITDAAINGIATSLPHTKDELLSVFGMGHKRVEDYGAAILQIVASYTGDDSTTLRAVPERQPKKVKVPTQQITYEMYKSGKTLDQIAAERSLTLATIQNHLLPHIESGDIDVHKFVSDTTLQKVSSFILSNPESNSLKELYDYCNGTISYIELKFALTYLKIRTSQ